jgi:prepilin-type N-terminal cleavage/methylation domain-containing protein
MKQEGARPPAAPLFFVCRSGGWTLIELIVVLAVAAVVTFFAVRGFQPKDSVALQQAERLRNDVRHVQTLASTLNKSLQLKQGPPLPAACPTATYWVIDCTVAAADPCTGAPNTPIVDPVTRRSYCVTLEPGFALAGGNLQLDPLGRPKNGASLVTTNTTFTINGGSTARTVVVTPLTGFVAAQ